MKRAVIRLCGAALFIRGSVLPATPWYVLFCGFMYLVLNSTRLITIMGWAGSLCPERVLKDFSETARPHIGERAVLFL